MKIIILMTLFAISLSSFSQVRTGSGGMITELSGSSNSEDRIISFLTILHYRDIQCRTDGNENPHITKDDFVQTYLKLSMIKSTFAPDEICQTPNAYLECLASPSVKSHFEPVLKDKEMKTYLMKKYDIKKKEAGKMLRFFEKVVTKECKEDDCKM